MSKSHKNNAIRFEYTACDFELLTELDAMVEAACRGDGRAVGAISIACGPTLLKEAQRELGELYAQDGGDVMQDLFMAMMEGKLAFPSVRGVAVPWMKKMAREMARERLKRRAQE